MSGNNLLVLSDDSALVGAVKAACNPDFQTVAADWAEIARYSDDELTARLASIKPQAFVFVPPLWSEAEATSNDDGSTILEFMETCIACVTHSSP